MTCSNRQRLGMTALGLVAGALATAPMQAAAEGPAPGNYEIGFVTEITGPIASAGVSYWRGAQLAAEEINDSGWIAENVTISFDDKESGSDAARAVQALTQFAADRDIIATACCILSPVAGAMRPVAQNAGIPLVFYGATKPGLPELPWVTSIVPLPGPQEIKMTEYLVENVAPERVTYFVNADNDAFQQRLEAAKSIFEAAGVETAEVISILGSDTDFTAPATQAIATEPDLIQVWTTQTPAVGIVSALRARGYEGLITASDVLSPQQVFEKAGEAVSGVPFPIIFAPEVSGSEIGQEFQKNYEAEYGEPPDTYSAQGYTLAYYYGQALRSLEGEPTREEMAEALAAIDAVEHNPYGGLPIIDGQADVQTSLIVAWSPEGEIVRWTAE